MKKTNLKAAILSISLLTVMAGAAVAPALGAMSTYFSDYSPTLVKMIIALPSLSIIFTSLIFNKLTQYLNVKYLAILGCLLYLIGGVGASFVSNLYIILVLRAILGIGVGILMPLSTGLIAYYFDSKEQPKLLGYSSAMNNLGGIIATIICGFITNIDWHYSFYVYFLGLIVIFLVILYIPKDLIAADKKDRIGSKDIKTIFPYMIAVYLVMLIFYAIPSSFSIVMVQSKIAPQSIIGILMASQNLFAFITGLLLAKVIQRFRHKTKYIGFTSLFIGTFLLSIMSNIYICLIGMMFIGIGLGISTPLVNLQISKRVIKEKVPAAMSIMSIALYLGQFSSPLVLEVCKNIFNLTSLFAPFMVSSVFAFILIIYTGFLKFEE